MTHFDAFDRSGLILSLRYQLYSVDDQTVPVGANDNEAITICALIEMAGQSHAPTNAARTRTQPTNNCAFVGTLPVYFLGKRRR